MSSRQYRVDVPVWIQTVTQSSDFDGNDRELAEHNFLKGSYLGHTIRIEELEAQLAEANQKVDLAMAYEAETIAQWLVKRGYPNTHDLVVSIREGVHHQ